MNSAPDALDALQQLLARYLHTGQACSEYELLRWLQEPQQGIFCAAALSDTHTLFRSHFLLMHCLYRLQQQWAAAQQARLQISALHIQKHPWPAASQLSQPDQHDPLAAYYLDLQQLETPEHDIERLLQHFWQQMLQPQREPEDLKILELSAPVTAQQIRLQYRRLAMRHHPDRGGDEQRFRDIQSAYQRLRQRYL